MRGDENIDVLRQKNRLVERENERLTERLTAALRLLNERKGMRPEMIELNRFRTGPLASATRHGMIPGMTTTKIAVSLPRELVDTARRAVRRKGARSVSAYVADALRTKAKLDDLESLLNEMLAESGGPLTAAEAREADKVLGRRKRSRRHSR